MRSAMDEAVRSAKDEAVRSTETRMRSAMDEAVASAVQKEREEMAKAMIIKAIYSIDEIQSLTQLSLKRLKELEEEIAGS